MMNVVFIGGLTNGKIVYDYLLKNRHTVLQMAIVHPNDPNRARGVCFEPRENVVFSYSANEHLSEIRALNPDLIIVAGWSELLCDELVALPKLGTIGFHPSKLPLDKGRSVLAWQLEEGYTQTALTMFYYNDFPDGGDIIAQEPIDIDDTDYINDVLDKVDKAIYNLMHAYFPLIRQNKAPRMPQPDAGVFRRLRSRRDSQIDWSMPARTIYNKVRAISHPYPGAETTLEGELYKVWRVKIEPDFPFGANLGPGKIIAKMYDGSLMVKSRDHAIHIVEYDKI